MSTKVVTSFLIRPIWDLQGDMGSLEEILLYFDAEIIFISEYYAIMIFPSDIVEVVDVMDTCHRHVKRTDNSTYPADSV